MPVTGAMRYARVIVDVEPEHLDRPFDYRIPEGLDVAVGHTVQVVFAGRRRRGWVVDVSDTPAADVAQIRDLRGLDGEHRWFDPADLRFFRWVADRYAASLASVLRHAFPRRSPTVDAASAAWGDPAVPVPAQRPPCPATAWRPYAASPLLKAAAGNPPADGEPTAFLWRPLPGDDRAAMAADLVSRCLASGRSALVLTPQPFSPLGDLALAQGGPVAADLRAPAVPRPTDRYRALLRCRLSHATVAVGERSGVFAPLRNLGLILVDDEANPAYKERRSPRFHARDVALARARFADAVCVLVSDLPSDAAWRLLGEGHLRPVLADRGVERDRAPRVEVVDIGRPRPGAQRTRLAPSVSRRIGEAVRAGGLAVILAARRGEGAGLVCPSCGRLRACRVCGAAVSAGSGEPPVWLCRVCDWQGPPFACRDCGHLPAAPLGAGAGRLAAELRRSYPDADVVRMEGFDAPGPQTRPAIAVLTRGSVLSQPRWLGEEGANVVVAVDADTLLNRPTVVAGEDALRLWLAAAQWISPPGATGGTAGRGVFMLQTREPTHPAVQALVRWDPDGFWRREAERRAELRFPPSASLVRIDAPLERAAQAAAELGAVLPDGDEVVGPGLDGELLVKSARLRGTLDALVPLRHRWARDDLGIRVTVDPLV